MDETRIIPNLRAADRWEAIDELIEQLAASAQIDPASREAISAAVKKREISRSTGIGSGIAIPHCRTALVNDLAWAFGRCSAGLDFAAFDKLPVKFIFLFAVPEGQFQKNLTMLANIAKFFRGDQVLHDLAVAPDATAISKIIRGGLR